MRQQTTPTRQIVAARQRHRAARDDRMSGNARPSVIRSSPERAETSQLPVARWHELIGDPTYADAILDRLVNNAHRVEIDGESMRRHTTAAAA